MERKNSQLQSLLEMIALSGEYSVAAVERLLPKEAYRRKIITKGKNDKLLNTIYINKLRGYRLTSKAKKALLGVHFLRCGELSGYSACYSRRY